jgi:hypothetical protein
MIPTLCVISGPVFVGFWISEFHDPGIRNLFAPFWVIARFQVQDACQTDFIVLAIQKYGPLIVQNTCRTAIEVKEQIN